MAWAGHVARMGDMRNIDKILVGKHEEKRPFERPGSKWEEDIRLNHREI
jgi:hypothetical protein